MCDNTGKWDPLDRVLEQWEVRTVLKSSRKEHNDERAVSILVLLFYFCYQYTVIPPADRRA